MRSSTPRGSALRPLSRSPRDLFLDFRGNLVRDPFFDLRRHLLGDLRFDLGRSSRDGVAGDLFAPLTGKEDERQVRVRIADDIEKLQPVHTGHIVVADDAVDGLSLGT